MIESKHCIKIIIGQLNWGKEYAKVRITILIDKDIRSLIKVRNNLLEDQRLVEKWRLSLVHPNFTPKQLSEYFKYCQKMFSDFEYSIFNTFKVPKLGFYRESNDIDINEASDISESENNDEDVGLTCSEPDNE